MESLFRIALTIIIYTYIGYGLVLFLCVSILRLIRSAKKESDQLYTPSLTIIVTAYNEAGCIEEKINNTFSLNYPADQIRFIFVTDGSDDGTPGIVANYPSILLLHEPARSGKISAMHRAMKQVETDIVLFTDANTIINHDALLQMARHYRDERVGGVAGEKRIDITNINDATSGEGFYWKYESILKQYESELYSVVGAAGELFSIRSALYEPVKPDTIIDDFMISMQVCRKGYRIRYEPAAFAIETTSASVTEERKRKTRIAAGAVQAILRLRGSLFSLSYPLLGFSYISHRLLRWAVTPYLLLFLFVSNIWLVWRDIYPFWITGILYGQSFFYGIAFAGWLLREKKMPLRILFLPYYFCLMNYGMIAGMLRYVFTGQTVSWEKAARK